MRREPLLLLGLLGAAGLWLWSRARPGAAADVVDFVKVTASKVVEGVLPRGIRNNNPGNLRYIARNPWQGQVGHDDAGFGVYDTMANGVRAAARQLLKYGQSGKDTVRSIVTTWAPPKENDTEAYVARVARALGVVADQRIDVDSYLEPLATEIFRHENGGLFTLMLGDIARWVRS